jgi:plastocyanin
MRAWLLGIVLVALACSAGEAAARPATIKISIEGMTFSPAAATAKRGDTIVWSNTDVVAHTVTSKTGLFDSKLIPPGGTWKYVVRKPGEFDYKCSYHLPMSGRFTVR